MSEHRKNLGGGFAAGRALDYSLRALCYMAGKEDVVSSLEIARAKKVPRDYLIQLMQSLRSAGIVFAKPGKDGGYGLARDAGETSVADVIAALGGGPSSDDEAGAEAAAVNDLVDGVLKGLKLADLFDGNEIQKS